MNMRQKQVAVRAARRNRYVAAVRPLRTMYGCTAAQVAGCVQGTLSQNKQLTAKIAELESKLDATAESVHAVKTENVQLKAKNDQLTRENEELTKDMLANVGKELGVEPLVE